MTRALTDTERTCTPAAPPPATPVTASAGRRGETRWKTRSGSVDRPGHRGPEQQEGRGLHGHGRPDGSPGLHRPTANSTTTPGTTSSKGQYRGKAAPARRHHRPPRRYHAPRPPAVGHRRPGQPSPVKASNSGSTVTRPRAGAIFEGIRLAAPRPGPLTDRCGIRRRPRRTGISDRNPHGGRPPVAAGGHGTPFHPHPPP